MTPEHRCRCCGVVVTGAREQIHRCSVCDICDGSHGFDKQQRVIRMVAIGRLTPYTALAICAFDDAWLVGKMRILPNGDVCVDDPVKRWEVALAWARTRGEQAPMAAVVESALAPFQDVEPTPDVMERAEAEVRAALHAWNPNVTVQFASSGPAEVVFSDDSITLPASMFGRPRGSA